MVSVGFVAEIVLWTAVAVLSVGTLCWSWGYDHADSTIDRRGGMSIEARQRAERYAEEHR